MGDIEQNIMKQFKDEYYKYDDSVKTHPECEPEYMHVTDPVVLASFVAFCRGGHIPSPSNQSVDTCVDTRATSKPDEVRRVFMRGCTRNHPRSPPSLFRSVGGEVHSQEMRKRLWWAYQGVLTKLKEDPVMVEWSRWSQPNLGAVLQHYGIRTPWLDVVDNLYTAIWFAVHDFETRGTLRVAVPSEQDWGWILIYVDACPNQPGTLIAQDIVGEQSSRHFRPHAQQGLSLAMQDDMSSLSEDQDFDGFLVARIRFPNSKRWKLRGHMFSTRFLFPAPEYDDSLKQLGRPAVAHILDEACNEHGLDEGTLGHVAHYM